MNSRLLLTASAALCVAAAACSADVGQTDKTGAVEQAAGSCSAVYGQCGGQGWTGATCCATGSVCTFSNTYYSQCLPGGSSSSSGDGIDHIARAAATAGVVIAIDYENNKLPNNGDPNYALYDDLILSSQMYIVSNGQMIFDPNAPGYAFVPSQAKAALAAIQDNTDVATYLTGGLTSCFHDTTGFHVWDFRVETLKGFPGTKSGTIAGEPASQYNTQLSNASDSYTVVAKPYLGQQEIQITETSHNDNFFGMLTWNDMHTFNWVGNNGPPFVGDQSKYQGGKQDMCTPFNGPRATAGNPYFLISINGNQIGPRQQVVPQQCQGGCTSVAVIDQVAYATPGPQYDVNGVLLGAQSNPFALDPSTLLADPTHISNWAVNAAANYGTFNKTIMYYGSPEEKWLLCGTNGSGC